MWFPTKKDVAKETIKPQRIEIGATDKKHSDLVTRKTFDLFDLSGETSGSDMENVPNDSDTEVEGGKKKQRRMKTEDGTDEPVTIDSQATDTARTDTSSAKIKMEEDPSEPSGAEQTNQASTASQTKLE